MLAWHWTWWGLGWYREPLDDSGFYERECIIILGPLSVHL